MAAVTVRERRDADLGACVAVLADAHRHDGYPVVWPSDPARWLAPDGVLGAWVADLDGAAVGQVLLRDGRDLELPDELAAAAGVPVDRLASVGRLVVASTARGRGAGAALLVRATDEAHRRGFRPALDVVADHRSSAIAGTHPDMHAYLGPAPN